MAPAPPIRVFLNPVHTLDLGYLHIVGAAYGGLDFTGKLRSRYAEYVSANGCPSYWTFQVSDDFLGWTTESLSNQVTNQKQLFVVYRTIIDARHTTWSDLLYQVVGETHSCFIETDGSIVGTPCAPPPANPPANCRYIAAATWYNVDVTAAVQRQLNSPPNDTVKPGKDCTVSISSSTLGIPEPAPGVDKQIALVYGIYILGQWFYLLNSDFWTKNQHELILSGKIPERDLRVNVLSATYGTQDVTEYLRMKYLINISNGQPALSFEPGSDPVLSTPDPAVPKVLCVVWRNTAAIVTGIGKLVNHKLEPNQPPDETLIGNYPIFGDVSGIFSGSWMQNSNDTLVIKPGEGPGEPLAFPTTDERQPHALHAFWGDKQCTDSVRDWFKGRIRDPTAEIYQTDPPFMLWLSDTSLNCVPSVPVGQFNEPKVMSLLLAYRRYEDNTIWDLRTFIHLAPVDEEMKLSRTLPGRGSMMISA